MDLQLIPSSLTSVTRVPDSFEDKQKWQFIKMQLGDQKQRSAAEIMRAKAQMIANTSKIFDIEKLKQQTIEEWNILLNAPEATKADTDRWYAVIAALDDQILQLKMENDELQYGNTPSQPMSHWRSPDGNVVVQDANWEPPISPDSPRQAYEEKIKKIAPEKVITNQTLIDWMALKFDEGFRKLFGNKVADFIANNPGGFYAGAAAAAGATLLSVGGTIGAWFSGSLSLLSKLATPVVNLFGKVGLGQRIRWLVRGKNFIFNFNWAMSDGDIKKRQEAAFQTLAEKVGETAGHGLASLICGKSVAAVAKMEAPKMLSVNPGFLVKLKQLEEGTWDQPSERWEETKESLDDLIRSTASVGLQVAFLEAYKNVRSIVKGVAKGLDFSWMFPGANEMIQKWGEEDGASWSFASSLESHIESVKVDWKQEMLEEFSESFLDHCDEQLMAISYAVS